MKFFVVIHKDGVPDEEREIEATSRFAVYDQVKREGGRVISLEEKTVQKRGIFSFLNMSIGTGVRRIEIIRMAKNLSAMLAAGLSVSRALSVIERQSGNQRLKAVTTNLAEDIKRGTSFHEALAKHPRIFPQLLVAMVRSGEESGSLSDSLSVVALQMERSEELVRKIRGAMIYPTIIIGVVVIVAILMLIFVVPTLTSTFSSLGTEAPLATRIIVALSEFMVNYAMFVLVILTVFIIGGIAFFRSSAGGAFALAVSLHLPTVKELVRETYSARTSRTLSSLLSAGVPVLEALAITKEVVGTRRYAEVIENAETRVKKGKLLSSSFSEHPKLYPILMSDMLTVGEETGKIADMLKQVAEFYENDVAQKTRDLSTIIEPALMILIGIFVGIFAVSMISPIYQLSSAM